MSFIYLIFTMCSLRGLTGHRGGTGPKTRSSGSGKPMIISELVKAFPATQRNEINNEWVVRNTDYILPE